MKDYRFNKNQLEHLSEQCLFMNSHNEKVAMKNLIKNLYIFGFITIHQKESLENLVEE